MYTFDTPLLSVSSELPNRASPGRALVVDLALDPLDLFRVLFSQTATSVRTRLAPQSTPPPPPPPFNPTLLVVLVNRRLPVQAPRRKRKVRFN